MEKFTRKSIVIAILFLLLSVGKIGVCASNYYDFGATCVTGQYLYFTITDATNHYVEVANPNGYDWSGFTKPTGDLVIPDYVEYNNITYSVTSIGMHAFNKCSGLTDVTFPNTLTSISGYGAFRECTGLTSLSFPNSLTIIGNSAFEFCNNLTSVTLPNSLVTIDDCAFNQCDGITTVDIPNSVVTIGNCAFYKLYNLTSVTVGSSVTMIKNNAFSYCTSLSSIEILAENPPTSDGNPFMNINKGNVTIFVPCGSLTAYQSASVWSGFGGYQDGSVAITASTNQTESGVVSGQGNHCPGSNCTLIASPSTGYTFINWTKDNNVVSNSPTYTFTVVSAGAYVANFSPNSYDITATANPAEGGTVTGAGTYQQGQTCTLTATANAGYIFINWTDNGVIVSTDVSYTFTVSEDRNLIAEFYENSTYPLTYSYNEDDHTATLTGRVDGVELEGELVIPETVMHNGETYSVTSIGTDAFVDCNGITELTIPSSVTKIGHGAFFGCTGLTSINIPASVVSIINNPFQACVNLAQIIVESGNACYDSRDNCNAIIETSTNSLVSGCRNTIIPDNVASIGELAFYSQPITEITIPASVEYIGTYAFMFTALSSITLLPETPPTLGRSPFIYFPSNFPFQVPCGSLEAYQNADGWNEFTNFQEKWYDIQVSVNLEDGGSVTGEGNYCLGSTCTLSANDNTGFIFVNWTEDGEEVSSENPFSFVVSSERQLVANFAPITYHWQAVPGMSGSMTFTSILKIDGVEPYAHYLEIGAFCGEECRGSALPQFIQGYCVYFLSVVGNTEGEPITFRLYDHQQQQELDLQCTNELTFVDDQSYGGEEFYEFNFISRVLITVVVDPEEGGTVSGAGDFFPGQEVTLTATAAEGYQFHSWMVDGTTVSTDATYTFVVNGPTTVTASFYIVQTVELNEGWTWWGTSVEQSGIDGLTALENSLNPNGRLIKNLDHFVQYSAVLGWAGNLTALTNEDGYRVQTTTACTASLTGPIANPEDHPITIVQNWTWIGYPVSQQQTVGEALANFEPLANDLIKSQGSSARYVPEAGWIPNDFTLKPGESYMYYSKASENKTLVFANGRSVVQAKNDDRYWRNNIHGFADNLCLLAVVDIDGEEQYSEEIELGAFVDGECRGSAKLMYVEYFDRYFAIMNIMGEDGDEIEFAIVDRQHHMTSNDSPTHLTFVTDAIVGDFDDPFVVSFGGTSSLEESAMHLDMFPNPVDRNLAFRLLIPQEETVAEIVVVNTMGMLVRHEAGAINLSSIGGLPTPGVYLVRVVCKSGNVYHSRLVVK